ncbi:MAG TPA: ChaN family lipoprotein, partial [Chthoniobacterales bacterium]|nr:ChaN family lipoprotein [Chthoniobacterales bacterium]
PNGGTDFAALVAQADIIYFPAERAASGGKAEPAAQLLQALRESGLPFAIGWDLINATAQPVLDELASKTGADREELIARIELAGTGRAREHCREVLRDVRLAGTPHLALRCPESIIAKLDARDRLAPAEERFLPTGYAPPPGDFETYAERLALNRAPAEPRLAASYRAYVTNQQFAAEKIVRYFRAAPTRGKLLVFLRANDLEAGRGVPRYVAQKLQVRQLVLDSTSSAPVRAKLLTRRESLRGSF